MKSNHMGFRRVVPVAVLIILAFGSAFSFSGALTNLVSSTSVTLSSSTTMTSTSTNATSSHLLPVIIIPGVAGSRLLVNLSSGTCRSPSNRTVQCQAWPFPTNATILQRLALQSDGATPLIPGSNVVVSGVLRSWPVNFYGTLIQNLTNLGYVENKTLFVFAYDWRMDLASDIPLLDSMVNNALRLNNASQVVLIAHSMGGLIAQGYVLQSNAQAKKVASIITLGTPYWGSPLAYYTAVNGYTFGNPYVNPLLMKLLAQNMTSMYALLPRSPFIFNSTSGAALSLNDSYAIRYKGVVGTANVGTEGNWSQTTLNIWTMNQNRLGAAMNFWKLSGTPAAPAAMPVKLYAIIGVGFQTLSGYRVTKYSGTGSYIELKDGTKVVMTPIFSDGDGTVPLPSAQLSTATATYYIQNVPGTFGYGKVSSAHGDLPGNPMALSIIDKILLGSPPAGNRYTRGSLQTNSVNFTLHSNAELSATDAYHSGYLGPNAYGGIDQNLSSGTYLNIDGTEYISLENTNDSYVLYINGTGSGQYQLTISLEINGNNETITYPEVAVTNQTNSILYLAPGETQVGQNGTQVVPPITVFEPNGTIIHVDAQNVSISEIQAAPNFTLDYLLIVLLLIPVFGVGITLLRRRSKN